MHKFDPNKMHKLDNPKRRALMPPEETLAGLGLKPGLIMADIGCGIGYFTIPAARLLGPASVVYAIDIEEEMLAETARRAADAGLDNIRPVKSAENTIPLADDIIDLALTVNVIHETAEPVVWLTDIRRLLRPGGELAIIDWVKERTEMGPPVEERLSETEVEGLLAAAGLAPAESRRLNPSYYLIKAKKIADTPA